MYLQSDPLFVAALRLLEDCEYPFVSCQVRLQVLKFLTDQFICNTAVRQDILSEGDFLPSETFSLTSLRELCEMFVSFKISFFI